MPPDLAATQERFWELITAPEGVERALPELARRDPEAVPLERWLNARGALGAVPRLDIYADMYFYRLLEVLQGDYAKVAAVVGEAAFHNLITDYLLAHPSTSPSIRDAGNRLPGFLKTHALSQRYAFLSDLALLEWARVEVFDRENVEVLTAQDLEALPPGEWGTLPLRAVPALRVLDLQFAAQEIFAALDRGEAAAPEVRPLSLLVWRRRIQIWMRPALPGEEQPLALIRAGCTFAQLCEELRRSTATDERAARHAFELLSGWLDAGLLRQFNAHSQGKVTS